MSFEVRPLRFRHILDADRLRFGLGDVGGDIRGQRLEIFRASDEIGLAVHFHQHSQFRIRTDEGCDQALLGRAALLPDGGRDPLLAEINDRLLNISIGGNQRLLALHHARACAVAKLFY